MIGAEYQIKFKDFEEILYNIKNEAENETQLKWAIYYLFKEIGKRANLLRVTDFIEKSQYFTVSGDWLILDLVLNDEVIWSITNIITKQLLTHNKVYKII